VITSTNHPLPFLNLSDRDFERLCLWVATRERYEKVQHVGASGNDKGQDVLAGKDGGRVCIQCKRYKEFGPSRAIAVVDEILKLRDSEQPTELILAVACDVSLDTREALEKRADGRFACTVWAATELDEKVKRDPKIVAEFFGARPAHRDTPFILPQADVSTFTGRVEELDLLRNRLIDRRSTKVCTIAGVSGTGGIGKSALACHFAHTYREEFPDGVIGLRIDGKDTDTIAREFVRSAGVELDAEDDRGASALMQETFGHCRSLLIFDNADDASVRELLPGGDRCAVIVTTRDRTLSSLLDIPAAGRIDLAALQPEEARELLGKLLDDQRIIQEPDAVDQILRLVGNLPLALQIVGANLRMQPWRSLSDYAKALEEERTRLERLKVRGDLHLDVRASFSLSLRILEPAEVDFLACLSVCAPAGFSILGASAAAGCDQEATHERLGVLCRYSLLNQVEGDSGRFVFHPLLHLFAKELADERELKSMAEDRHAEFFVGLVKAGSSEVRDSDAFIKKELDDILIAAEWLRREGKADYQFVIRLEPFFQRQGHWQEATRLMGAFLALAERLGDANAAVQLRLQLAKFQTLRGRLADAEEMLLPVSTLLERMEPGSTRLRSEAMWLNSLGGVLQRQGRFDPAAGAFRGSHQLLVEVGDRRGQAMVLNSLGGVLQRQGDFDQAAKAFQRSVQIEEGLTNRRGLAMVLNSLGGVLQRQGMFDQAVDAFLKSARLEEEINNRRGLAMILNSLGGVYQRQGRFDEAVDAFLKSDQILVELSDKRGQAMVLNSLGGVYQRLGRFDQAVDAFQKSYQLLIELLDLRGQAMVLNSLGGVYQRLGRFEQAVDAFQKSYDISSELGDQRSLAMVLNSLGGVYQRLGQFDQAVDAFQKSYDISSELGDQRSLAMVLNSLGGVYQRLGRFEQAVDAFQKSYDISSELGDQHMVGMVLNSLGGVYQRLGRFDEAVDAFRLSYDLLVRLGDRRGQAMVLNSLGQVLQLQNRLPDAIDAFEQSRQIGESLGDRRHLAMVHTAKGKALLAHGDIQNAVAALRTGFEIDESLGNGRGLRIVTPSLMEALTRLNRQEEAEEYRRRAAAINPTFASSERRQDHRGRTRRSADGISRRGVVKRVLHSQAGVIYGFIAPDDGSQDIYFRDGYVEGSDPDWMSEGTAVEVEAEEGPKGPRAVRVRRASAAGDAPPSP